MRKFNNLFLWTNLYQPPGLYARKKDILPVWTEDKKNLPDCGRFKLQFNNPYQAVYLFKRKPPFY